jgi:formylmethanofuran dehydrogenase subunit E
MWILWNEVYASLVPRVTFQNSFCAQLHTANQAVLFDGFLCVVGTTGVKAALAANEQAQG